MKSKYIFIILILAVAALFSGLWWINNNRNEFDFFSRGQQVPQDIPTEENSIPPLDNDELLQEVLYIEYLNEGFSPNNIVIDLQTSVTWINKSDQSMWVASDPHPSHNIYPEFDMGAAIAPGGEYSFFFNKSGSFGYHNHLAPQNTGSVVVRD